MSGKASSTPPPAAVSGTSGISHSNFEKQRDLLIQEISNNIDTVVYNLDILNRSLNESIQVGKEFDDVGRLWSNFYDGMNQLKQKKLEEQNKTTEEQTAGPESIHSSDEES
ncbi:predicted protein [Scheffersomyces stipitis CBS 6054]|uniref:DASH complex subunit DAD1 n=1 Tax=Scheffersomyces stipitis (strain ATCC 58785 / CBS 6054 / NBRC 10063 / NRRL Y-11545) TaxID=322104 RepID=A3GI56_PICST|nr:predicted protein [Scheffersomyces stipitis CBS 6054]EAZ63175.1 predicted protein [Scheffersomyces stipitis CBS 6054]KAG2735443.1 hypothetical protein G9P44_001657 [Scheffersomyces stipitis]